MLSKRIPIPKAPRLKPLKVAGDHVPDFLHGAARAERGDVTMGVMPGRQKLTAPKLSVKGIRRKK